MKDVEIIGMLKTYVAKCLVGAGALKGAPCTIKSITYASGINTLVFEWTDNNGDKQESTMLVYDGARGETGATGAQGPSGPSGADGYSPTITVKTSTSDSYVLTITDKNGSYDTPNLKGSGGGGGASAMSDLTDVDLAALANGSVLVYDSTAAKWEATALSFADISDVDLTGITDGQILAWDATAGKFAPADNTGEEYTAGEGIEISQDNEITSKIVMYTGTKAAWDALPLADKKKYTHASFTDDTESGIVDNVPTENSDNLVKSGGVWSGLESKADVTDLDAKQDTLTFDNAPTENSNNPVKSGGVYSANQNIYEVIGRMGAKNLNSYPYYDITRTQNGITFTDNGDGTITVDGTASGDAYFTCHSRLDGQKSPLVLSNGRYILSGSPSGASVSGAYLKCGRTYNGTYSELGAEAGSGATITLAGDDYSEDSVRLQIQVAVKSGTVVDNLVFKPMIRLASDTDSTYQPYAKTNRELTAENQTLTNQANDMANVLGSKNLLPLTKRVGGTANGVTFTVNDDDSITVNGTATSGIGQNEGVNKIFYGVIPKGEYLISCKKDKTTSVRAYYALNGGSTAISVEEDSVLSLDSDSTLDMWIYVANTAVLNNVTFYPMIRLASIQDDTYEPYAKTNRELTEDTTALLDNLEVNGAVNMFDNILTSQVVNGITYTVNDDVSVTCNGTATANGGVMLGGIAVKSGKTYKISGCPSGGDADSSYALIVRATNSTSGNVIGSDIGNDFIYTPTSDTTVYLQIRFASGQTASNLKFYPMITVPSYNGDYVPYAKSNRELTDDVATMASKVDADGSGTVYNISVSDTNYPSALVVSTYTIGALAYWSNALHYILIAKNSNMASVTPSNESSTGLTLTFSSGDIPHIIPLNKTASIWTITKVS